MQVANIKTLQDLEIKKLNRSWKSEMSQEFKIMKTRPLSWCLDKFVSEKVTQIEHVTVNKI